MKKVAICITAVLLSVAVVVQVFYIQRSARITLAEKRARLIKQNRVPFEKKVLTPHLSPNIQILQNTQNVRDLIKFQDSYFAATSGGLVQFSENGKRIRHFTVLDGLPESDLTAITVYQNKLFIGTRTKDLITFDGEKFENFIWTDRRAQQITSFLETEGRLLIGTFDGGLIEFDGKYFTEIKAQNERIRAINILFKNDTSIYAGTFNNGLWIYSNDIWMHFAAREGLSSNRIVGIAVKDKNLYVATDLGLSILQNKNLRALVGLPSLSSLAQFDNQLLLTKDDGTTFTFDKQLKELPSKAYSQNARLKRLDDKLWLLSGQGISQIKGGKITDFDQEENEALTDNFVSALALDKNDNLWVGTFRNGIDVFSPTGKKLKHVESETVREINFLQLEGEKVTAATSAGLLYFKSDYSNLPLTKKDGLPVDSITHFTGAFVATSKGLAFKENNNFRVISTLQGLPSNSIYATLQIGKTIYAGTLGGLAQVENGRVVRTFKDSNSELETNWVTALRFVRDRLFIGTYGGGLFELSASGEIRKFEGATGKFAVNPNSIFNDEERLYVGTLEGVKILNFSTQEWTTLKTMLPAETVMSITGDDENIYFGTTNGIARVRKNYFAGGE